MNATMIEPPWYRQLWPWILIALPASAVLACAVTIWLVLQSPDREVAHEIVVPVNEVLGKSSVVPPKQ
jgi:hypothetical protein